VSVSDDSSEIETTVDQFFDALTDQYAGVIERCFPRYREMLWALLDYLPTLRAPQQILELGSGTGNLSVLLADRFPEASLHMVDVSADSLAVCRSRLGDHDRFEYRKEDFRELRLGEGQFDLVVSSIAIHHLTSPEKQQLFSGIHCWLKPQGVFALADQCSGATADLYRRHIENWKTAAMDAGSTQQEWEMWMKHQAEHDHHDTLSDQIDWLRTAGFDAIDCPWRYLLWAVLQARKSR
jgi:tRNA (cmo5U34)-methyltransferase